MKKLFTLFTVSLIVTMVMLSGAAVAASEKQEFLVSIEEGYNPIFTVTNVIDSYINDYDIHITTEESAEMVCNFIFQEVSIEKDGIVYSDDSENPISAVVEERNKNIIPDGPVMPAHYDLGYTLQFNEPGEYIITTTHSGMDMTIILIVAVKQNSASPIEVTAIPSTSKVLVNGAPVSISAYNISGNNYFKLRDIAMVLKGTEKQFNVEWDNTKKAINLISSQPYTVVGGELVSGEMVAQNASLNKSSIYKDGKIVSLLAYNINGNNYFKLRDLAKAFNIGLTWNGSTNTIEIDTSKDYIE